MPGEHFGDEELINHSQRNFTVICEKQGVLITIKKKVMYLCYNFLKL